MIKTVDTDVVVLAVAVTRNLPLESELWLAFRAGQCFILLSVHAIAAGQGPENVHALPMFHALTGSDTVSSFVGCGKKTVWTVWAVWHVFPELRHALIIVTSAPDDEPQDVLKL